MRTARDEGFEQYVRERRGALLRFARTLTAGDDHRAEDLVQAALVRLYRSWQRPRDDTDAYARRTLVNLLIDEQRRQASRREQAQEHLPEQAAPERPLEELDADLVRALACLPPRMRAAVVLRHVEGRSVEETATVLGCNQGTVKSTTSRGLDRLRQLLAAATETDTTIQGVKLCKN